ncbi:MAG: ABC transporter permease [Alicyclobacillaceae bacterium]|uniref:ABC transporter permease n=1 Tax=Alicyclobacillus sp. SP_1 TaxID=2942475 RepID=UPI0021572C69|nr:ABC transporter permease [Alicyclobacillus sp. SP_1]MCY0889095.1 ABC transporter permease [Alicyclobacillaceae bacterium]
MTMSPLEVVASATATETPRRVRWRSVRKNVSLWLGAAIVFAVLFIAVFAPLISPYSPVKLDYTAILQPPSAAHWLGTDDLGRDILTRIFYGARTSMEVAIGSVALATIVGVPIGLVSGFYRGVVDEWLVMRVVDAIQAFPFLILALVLAAVLGPGIRNVTIAIAVGYLPVFIRTVRAQVMAERQKEYVQAARMVGASDVRLMFRHIFPNTLTPLIVQVTLGVASGIVAEASLSYLGLGAQPPTPSWGSMLHTAQGYMTQAPWMAIVPGIAIAIAVLGFNLLGDGLQIRFDPRKNRA